MSVSSFSTVESEKISISYPDSDNEDSKVMSIKEFDIDLIRKIPCPYTNIIGEFADVEIFMISIDSMLIEFTAHVYHNWELGGQTIVLAEQMNKFLNSLADLNAKFILVWFTDLKALYEQDSRLSFLHSFTIAYLTKNLSKWEATIECFSNLLDEKWNDLLHRLTPSFLLMSLENPKEEIFNEIDFSSRFISTAIQLITNSIPVVFFNAFSVNFSTVMAFRLSTVPLFITNLNEKIAEKWNTSNEVPTRMFCTEIQKCKNSAEFWAKIIKSELENKKSVDTDFENLCISVLISSLICEKLKTNRKYPEIDFKKGSSSQHRRRLREAATKKLYSIDFECLNFNVEDLWDGRLIYRIYQKIAAKEKILPFRLQEDFAKLHNEIGLKTSIPTDESEELLEQLSPSEDPSKRLLIRDIELFDVQNQLLDEFVPNIKKLLNETKLITHEISYHVQFTKTLKWSFKPIVEEKLQMVIPEKLKDHRLIKKRNRERQKFSSFFQNFADSLEGRGNDLLVDFSRTPRLTNIEEDEQNNENNSYLITNGTSEKKLKKASKIIKVEKLSKKDQILKANKDSLNKKQIESDKTKISFANQVKANAIIALEDVFRKLELNESKALCIFEKILRYAELFNDKLLTFENLEQKRDGALDLVETIKDCFRKYFDYFDAIQKEKVIHIWACLGFVKTTKRLTVADKLMDLEINLVDYQLYHGGRLIDILSDPKKDNRVIGFLPDGWQRKMLDVVDQYQSALIVAPTSAGKTFVSYYCIEKVLRNSNDDVVVYISPSKSLMNQVLGSIYARFRNKPMGNNKVLFGTFTLEYSDNVLNCQVLVTIPECLEIILLSQDTQVQQLVSRIKYVILDEMHCINAPVSGNRSQGHIWEHIFLLLRCPFLALSATIRNVEIVQEWFQKMEESKALDGSQPRQVIKITYDERWSELELAIQRMQECPKNVTYNNDNDLFIRGASVQSILPKEDSPISEMELLEDPSRTATPNLSEIFECINRELAVQQFHPYSVYKLEKIKMFGIPEDQRMTARQVVELYTILAAIDADVKDKFLPCKFFNYEIGSENAVWLSRKDLRYYENKLKETIIEWLNDSNKEKINKVFVSLGITIHEEFEKRSKPFNMRNSALHNITSLVDNLVKSNRLPALCFNDDRDICEQLSIRLFNELERRENSFRSSADFHNRFNSKAEEKAAKLAKRRRDEEEKEKKKNKKKKTTLGEDGKREGGRYDKEDEWQESTDQFILQRIKLEEELSKFKVLGRWSDEDIYNKTITRLSDRAGNRPSTQMLLRLFKRGIGFHHDGLNSAERGSVEILFRNGFLGIVFSTSTLALGMNMPCKTVVFGIDTPMLTPLQFRQMSGRAGRRGFDPAGTVIFMALPTSKIRRLLTSSLATLRGNVPYTTSFMLRLLTYIKGPTLEENSNLNKNPVLMTNKEKLSVKRKPQIETTDVTNIVVRQKAALTLLKNPFALYTRKEHKEGVLQNLLRALTLFNIQQLLKQQLLNNKAEPIGFANLAVHLSKFEQGNLAFINLLQTGVLHRLNNEYIDHRKEFKDVLINILAYLFTNKPLPIFAYKETENFTELPILKPIPEEVENILTKYNESVDKLLIACLQWASPNQQIEDTIFALTGNTKGSLSTFKNDVVSVFDEDLVLDPLFIPAFSSEQKDHRGRKILRNSYVYDFWKKADRKSLVEQNKLLISEIWYLIKDFHMVLSAISIGLNTMKDKDPISLIMTEIEKEFISKFNTAFGMQKRENNKTEEIKN